MDHITTLMERYMRRESDKVELDDDEFDFNLDGEEDDELDLDIGDDGELDDTDYDDDGELDDHEDDHGDTEERLNDLEDKVTDILNKLSQVIAQDAVDGDIDDEEGEDPDVDDGLRGDDDEGLDDLDAELDDEDDEDDEVKEYEDNLPPVGDADDDDYEADGKFDIDTYGVRGVKKARRFKARWGKHRISEKHLKAALKYGQENPKASFAEMASRMFEDK